MVSVAGRLAPVITAFLGGETPIAFRFWDGSSLGPSDAGTAIVLKSPRALTRLLYAPGELGFVRAFVSDDLDIEGDVFEMLGLRDMLETRTTDTDLRLNSSALRHLLKAMSDSRLFHYLPRLHLRRCGCAEGAIPEIEMPLRSLITTTSATTFTVSFSAIR